MKLQNLPQHLLLLIAFSIPFNIPGTYSVLPIVALICFLVIQYRSPSPIPHKAKFLALPFIIYAVWSLPSFLHTQSLSFLEIALPFLIFPIFVSRCSVDARQLRKILRVYITAVVISFIASLIAALYHFYNTPPRWGRPSDFFFHVQFTEGLFDIHPTYYGLMGCVATLMTILTLKDWKRLLIIILLTFFIFIINARITIFIHTLIILAFFGSWLFQKYRFKAAAILIIAGSSLYALNTIFGLIYDYPHRQIAVDIGAAWDRSDDTNINDAEGGVITRFAMWRNSLATIEKSPWIGYGFQNEKQALMLEAVANNVAPFIIENARAFNSHNQVLSYLINFGIVGFGLILSYYSLLLRYIYKKRMWYALSFLLTFFICGLTESIFERMWGVILFTFFFPLLVLKTDNQND